MPISVAMPVAVTTARPRPRVTAVPLKTMFTRSARPAGSDEGADVLQDRFALAGERRLGHRQRGSLQQPGVGANRVAFRQEQDVARHEVGSRDALLAPVAHDARGGRRHALERGDRLLGARFLHVAEHGIENDDHRR